MGNNLTDRELLDEYGQYTITEVSQFEGVISPFDSYELVIRGHTSLLLGESPPQTSSDTHVHPLALRFAGAAAVSDIGTELLRASHIVIPEEGLTVFEDVTNTGYDDTRWIPNPLNHTPPGHVNPVRYPRMTRPSGLPSGGSYSDDTHSQFSDESR